MRESLVKQKLDYNFTETPKSKCLSIRFLAPGLKQYKELNKTVNITPEVLKELAKSHQGIPVIINHQDVTFENVDRLKVGTVGRVFINDKGFVDGFGKYHKPDHWAWCDITIDNERALQLIENGWEFSTTYEGLEGKATNSLADSDIIGGNALHLAIVKKGRYNTQTVFNNSKKINNKQTNNKLFMKNIKDKIFDAVSKVLGAEDTAILNNEKPEEIAEKASYENKYYKNTDGEKVMINDLISQVRNFKKMEAENEMMPEDEIEIDGELMTVEQAVAMIAEIAPEEIVDAAEDIIEDKAEEELENEKEEEKEMKNEMPETKPLANSKSSKLQNSKPVSQVLVGKENFTKGKAETNKIKTFTI